MFSESDADAMSSGNEWACFNSCEDKRSLQSHLSTFLIIIYYGNDYLSIYIPFVGVISFSDC